MRFFVLPEFKPPRRKRADPKTAVADPTEVADLTEVAELDEDAWIWNGDETMHPFWAIRRLTTAQLFKEQIPSKLAVDPKEQDAAQPASEPNEQKPSQLAAKPEELRGSEPMPRFNCQVGHLAMTSVNVVMWSEHECTTITRTVHVPFIVNTEPLAKGEELILHLEKEKSASTRKRTWRDEHAEEMRKNQKKE